MFDRYAIVIGSYWYGSDYTHGQGSYEYRLMCRASRLYRPGCSERGIADQDEAAKEVYARLVRRHQSLNVSVGRFIKAAKGRVPGLGAPYRQIYKAFTPACLCY